VARNASSNDTVLDYDESLSDPAHGKHSWWIHTFGSNQFAIWHPTGTAELFSAKATSAVVDQCFAPGVTVDNGSPFTWIWRGPWQSPTFYRRRRFPTPYYKKNFRQVRVMGGGEVDIYQAHDFFAGEILRQQNSFDSSTTTWAGAGAFGVDYTFGDSPMQSVARVFTWGVHNAISIVFQGTSTSADNVQQYVLMVSDRKDLVVS
jgi:hypothetical protein